MRMIALKSAVLVLALGTALVAAPVLARDFTDDEKQGLSDAIGKFDDAMKANDFNTVVDASIPPKLMDQMATTYKVPADQLKTTVVQQMQQAMASVKVDSYGMDTASTDYEQAADGTPYALIPTAIVMEVGANKIKSSGETLAIIDDGKWYLLNVGQKQQVDMLKSVYPAFADVTFPEAKMEPAP